MLEGVPAEERTATLRLELPDGTLLSGGDAALATLGRLRATRPLQRAVVAARAQPLARAVYSRIAANRERLGRLVPDGRAPRRFP